MKHFIISEELRNETIRLLNEAPAKASRALLNAWEHPAHCAPHNPEILPGLDGVEKEGE